MDAIEKALKRLLVLSIAFSVMFAAGIPLIPVGASKGLWALMIVGIVFTAAGFYGTPMLWTAYGARRGLEAAGICRDERASAYGDGARLAAGKIRKERKKHADG